MHARDGGHTEEEALFDLPLRRSEEAAETEREAERSGRHAGPPRHEGSPEDALGDPDSEPNDDSGGLLLFDDPTAQPQPAVASGDPGQRSLLRLRLEAGVGDLAVLAGSILILVAGAALTTVRLSASDYLLIGLVGLVLSFLCEVIPLLFWGQTAGMRWRGLRAVTAGEERPSVNQAVWRWFAGWITRLGLGLPGLIRLADRFSRTRTVRVVPEATPDADDA